MTDQDDFYVEDEPVEKVRAAFQRGVKGRTWATGGPITYTTTDNPAGLVIDYGTGRAA